MANEEVVRSQLQRCRARRWTLTINEPTEFLEDSLEQFAKDNRLKYIEVGMEYALSTGRQHWQEYFEFKCQRNFSIIKDTLTMCDV